MKKVPVMIVAVIGLIVCFSACTVNNNGGTNPQQGYFLVANVSPDAPPLNVTINNSSFLNNLNYGGYTPYYGAVAGSYTFAFYSTGNTPVLSSNVNISASSAYSFFVIDSFSNVKSSFIQDNIPTPNGDTAYIRFFNFSPNVGSIQLTDSAAKKNLYTNRSFNDQDNSVGNTAFAKIVPGEYNLQLRLGTADSSVVASRKDTLNGGHVYTIFAKGTYGATGTQALSIGQILNY